MTVIGKAAAPASTAPLKVTGTAQYTSDHTFPGMLYAVPVGRHHRQAAPSTAIDTARRRADAGRARRLQARQTSRTMSPHRRRTSRGHVSDEHAAAASTTTSCATTASTWRWRSPTRSSRRRPPPTPSRVTYKAEKPNVDPHLDRRDDQRDSERGDADAGFAGAPVTIDATLRDRPGNAQPDRDPRDRRRLGRRRADALRDVARRREPSQRAGRTCSACRATRCA